VRANNKISLVGHKGIGNSDFLANQTRITNLLQYFSTFYKNLSNLSLSIKYFLQVLNVFGLCCDVFQHGSLYLNEY